MGPLDDPMADDFFIPNPPLCSVYTSWWPGQLRRLTEQTEVS